MAEMSEAQIQEQIEAILVDAYGEDEQASAWEVAFQDEVQTPFEAMLLGVPVRVLGFQAGRAGNIQCQAARRDGQQKRWIGVEDLDAAGLPADFVRMRTLLRAWEGEEDGDEGDDGDA